MVTHLFLHSSLFLLGLTTSLFSFFLIYLFLNFLIKSPLTFKILNICPLILHMIKCFLLFNVDNLLWIIHPIDPINIYCCLGISLCYLRTSVCTFPFLLPVLNLSSAIYFFLDLLLFYWKTSSSNLLRKSTLQ